jgi:beta-galactosidase
MTAVPFRKIDQAMQDKLTTRFMFVAMVAIATIAGPVSAQAAPAISREIITNPFETNWRFLKADAPGAEQSDFNDITWRNLSVPHDWSIEGPFAETNLTGGAGAFLPSGIGWYRKHFSLPKNDSGRSVSIEFDGVMQNSEVWINGVSLGKRPFGYVSFSYELTGHLNFGGDNVLAVRADTSAQPASRWYSGAGIYRHVRLVVTDPIHIAQWGVFVTTPQVSAPQATVRVQTTIANQSAVSREVIVQTRIIAPNGKTIATAKTMSHLSAIGAPASGTARSKALLEHAVPEAGAPTCEITQEIIIPQPQLWNLADPKLYHAVSKIISGRTTLDETTTTFGIREAKFTSDTGFVLNGKKVVLKGVCLHHDGSAFGAAVPLDVWEQRLAALKTLGVNAIRTAHNPPAPEFLDLCDRMGFLVMDELFDCWTVAKNPYDYHLYFNEWSHIDERDTVRRDRNHPSIILYSIGNEIHDTPKPEIAIPIARGLVEVCHENDPSRPVTQALFRPNVSHDYDNGLADLLDVIGTNYRDTELLAAQRAKPTRKIVGTEQRHELATWLNLRDNPSHSGQFLWSGVDYLGESRRWPIMAAGSGLLDRIAVPKPMAFERQSWWSDKPMVFISRRLAADRNTPVDPGFAPLDRRQSLFSDWTPANLDAHEENVEIYSNCEQVELFLNGKSLGAKPHPANDSPRNWRVPFAPGTIKAVGSNGGKVVAARELRTAEKAARIQLETENPALGTSWDDVAFVRATIVDANGVVVPNAGDLISFKVFGGGKIVAVDSADNSSHEPFQASERHAFQGKCVAMVKASAASGKITISASAPGLKGSSVSIKAHAK